ncbi:DUF3068 domain-containing protein [Corynebacterium ulceribovis]|uniref:DUF3068 domain-containing protein n=1 Tax=Corynebacterium ulceribovis TaxID=487732 RepID=UPI0003A8D332|nr:DUF3068 domain-containing protein [Corynebacterium ulceribovis]
MLPRSRVVSVLLIMLGCVLLAAGFFAPRFIPTDGRMPLNIPTTTLSLYDENAESTPLVGEHKETIKQPVKKQFHAQVVPPHDDKMVTLRVGTTTGRTSENGDGSAEDEIKDLITARVWLVPIDRVTAQATGPARVTDQLAGDPAEVDMEGQWIKFPVGTEKQDYQVFDDVIRRAETARFVEETEIAGTKVYRFQQVIDKVNVAQAYPNQVFKRTAKHNGKDERQFLFHTVTRDWYVEPRTGLVASVHEDLHEYWGNEQGDERGILLRFNGQVSDEDSRKILDAAAKVKDPKIVRISSIVLLTLGAILALIGLIGAFRPGRKQATTA